MDAAIMTRLDEIVKALEELKSENSNMRKEMQELKSENSVIGKEILKTEVSDKTNPTKGKELLENKTLREIVEETHLEVKKIYTKMLEIEKEKESTKIMNNSKGGLKQINAKISVNERKKEFMKKMNNSNRRVKVNEGENEEENSEVFPVVEITRKTIGEERNWMKEKINEIKTSAKVEDGESLRETTVEEISDSIPFSDDVSTSCTIKLSNFLDSNLTDPQYHFWDGARHDGPSRVVGHRQEVFSFVGNRWSCCFLCSFAINKILRLTIRCYVHYDGDIALGVGFTPGHVPIDQKLDNKLGSMPEVPDAWINIRETSKDPQELFVTHRSLLVRGHMAAGPMSVVHVEILEMSPKNLSINSENETKKVVDGKSITSDGVFQNSGKFSKLPGNHGRFSCNIEIVNCLSVPLRNGVKFFCKCEKNDFMPLKVLSFQREIFFGADKANVQAMFSYDIDSTDFAIVVALKVGGNLNSFAAAFVQTNALAVTGAKELRTLMDPNQWKTHDYRKYTTAREGVKIIRMGNIRAELRMSEDEQSVFKIRLFAI